jgi:hypothetical protein
LKTVSTVAPSALNLMIFNLSHQLALTKKRRPGRSRGARVAQTRKRHFARPKAHWRAAAKLVTRLLPAGHERRRSRRRIRLRGGRQSE